jgi:TfoX/Sxy family transcriptional regulator of competence genes
VSYDEKLAERIRTAIETKKPRTESKMFGGLAFMVGGHMCCGVIGRDMLVRVGRDEYAKLVSAPHARPMDFTGKPLKSMIYVGPDGTRNARGLKKWVDRAVGFVEGLPAKPRKKKVAAKKGKTSSPSAAAKKAPTRKRAGAAKPRSR